VLIGVAAQQKHGQSEDKHNDAPDEIDVHARGALVNLAAAGKDAVKRQDCANDGEHHSHRHAKVKTHIGILTAESERTAIPDLSLYLKTKFRPTSSTSRPTAMIVGRAYQAI